jgi:protein-tyrosine phosphatase
MIDIHNHILPGLDDGARDIETSIKMAERCSELGYKKVFCSPHIMTFHFENNSTKIEEACSLLKKKILEQGIDLEIIPFAEVYLDESVPKRLDNKEIPMYNKKMLVEGPLTNEWPAYTDELLFQFTSKGIQPIVAHIERNQYLQNNIAKIAKIKESGCQIQSNILSILGYYGLSAKNCLKTLLKEDLIDYLATDMHHLGHPIDLYKKAIDKIKGIIGENQFLILSGSKIETE